MSVASVFGRQGTDEDSSRVAAFRPFLYDSVAYDASVQSEPISLAGSAIPYVLVRLSATTDCWIAFGENPTAVAGTGIFLPAGTSDTWRVSADHRVAAVKAAGGSAGTLSVVAMGNPVDILSDDDLVAEWRFDGGAGTTVTDYAGGHDLAFGAGDKAPHWLPEGLFFSGEGGGPGDQGNEEYASTDGGGGDWTFPSPEFHVDIVGYFFATPGTGSTGTDFIAVFGTTNTGAVDDDLCPLIVFREGASELLRLRIGSGAANVLSSPTSDGPFDDGWHHISIDYDGADVTVLMDGVSILTQNLAVTPNTIEAATQFGVWHDFQQLSAHMTMGYCAVYARSFSASENAWQRAALRSAMDERGVFLP